MVLQRAPRRTFGKADLPAADAQGAYFGDLESSSSSTRKAQIPLCLLDLHAGRDDAGGAPHQGWNADDAQDPLRRAEEHRYGSASTAEFIALAEEISERPLHPLFKRWLFKSHKP